MLPYTTVVCALDVDPGSARALVRAADLAERARATLHLVHVDPPFRDRLPDAPEAAFRDRVRAVVDRALGTHGAFEVLAPIVHSTCDHAPAAGVLRYAAAVQADVVVVGTHGRRGLGHLLLGSVAGEVLRRSPVPVLVVPDQAERTAPDPDHPIVLGADFSDHTRPALAAALGMMTAYGAPLAVAHVRDRSAVLDRVHDALDSLLEGVGVASRVETHVVPGRPADELIAVVRRTSAGLLVVGTHGRSGWDRLRLGSVAEALARRSPCPVLVAPHLARASAEGPPGAR